MSRFLGKAHPYLVLLRLLRCKKGKDGNDDKDKYDPKLYVRIISQAFYHERIVVTYVNEAPLLILFIQIYTYLMP